MAKIKVENTEIAVVTYNDKDYKCTEFGTFKIKMSVLEDGGSRNLLK